MNLIKTSIWSGIATITKLLSVLVINKALSILVGPSGLAIVGQFQNIQSIIATLSQGGINSGVVKYTAQERHDVEKNHDLWTSSFKITIFFTVIISLITLILSTELSLYFFNTIGYKKVFISLSVSLLFYSINQLLLSILNGLKEIELFIKINILQSIFSLFISVLLIYFFGLIGALYAIVLNQSVVFCIILIHLKSYNLIRIPFFFKKNNNSYFKRLAKYIVISLSASISTPMTYMFIRNYVGENYSWDFSGYWQAMMYISIMYVMVITTALSTYYLPRLSEIYNKKELRNEIINGYKVIIPITMILTFIVFILKDFIIWLLFTTDFNVISELFKWQLLGDFIKVCSWLLSFILVSKAMVGRFVFSEVFFNITLYLLCINFIQWNGLVGLSQAYALNYTLYFIYMFIVTYKYIWRDA